MSLLDRKASPELCVGMSRRAFVQKSALTLGAMGLSELLRARAAAGTKAEAKSVIMIYLGGGPSQLDTYDMKPEAPAEYRGELRAISTNVPGTRICELLPRQAKLADRFSIVRSMTWQEPDHQRFELCTGFPKSGKRASFGGMVSRFRQRQANGMPAFVSLSGDDGELREAEDPRYAGAQHRPFVPNEQGLGSLSLRTDVSLKRLADRKRLLADIDAFRRRADAVARYEELDAFNEQALSILTSAEVRNAFDLEREPAAVRERYGRKGSQFLYHRSEVAWPHELFLQARRLVEAGVPFVSLQVGLWDHHCGPDLGTIFENYRSLLPLYDQALSALLEDLRDRGLSDRVTVVVWGEFGRTPKLNEHGGRDHWPQAGSVLFAGGGLKMGQMIGETDRRGEQPVTRPYGPQNVFATLYQLLGIDPAATVPDRNGRPMYLLDDREPIGELF